MGIIGFVFYAFDIDGSLDRVATQNHELSHHNPCFGVGYKTLKYFINYILVLHVPNLV